MTVIRNMVDHCGYNDIQCSRKYPYPHHRGSLEILRGRGVVLKVKIFKGKYEPKLEFPGGGEFKPKKPSLGGVWIFSGTTQSLSISSCVNL